MSTAEDVRPRRTPRKTRALATGVVVIDNFLHELDHRRILQFLQQGPWRFGWKSKGSKDVYSFWHLHFAGHRHSNDEKQYACERELLRVPLMHWFWQQLKSAMIYQNQTLTRCYANGQAYGSDGTIHTDCKSETGLTAIYYPHTYWEPNWAGETALFSKDQDEIVASVYPKPNRLLIFKGATPHVARGVSRTCPELRIVLVFKTDVLPPAEKADDRGPAPEVSG